MAPWRYPRAAAHTLGALAQAPRRHPAPSQTGAANRARSAALRQGWAAAGRCHGCGAARPDPRYACCALCRLGLVIRQQRWRYRHQQR
jgi:hypothetical protein